MSFVNFIFDFFFFYFGRFIVNYISINGNLRPNFEGIKIFFLSNKTFKWKYLKLKEIFEKKNLFWFVLILSLLIQYLCNINVFNGFVILKLYFCFVFSFYVHLYDVISKQKMSEIEPFQVQNLIEAFTN